MDVIPGQLGWTQWIVDWVFCCILIPRMVEKACQMAKINFQRIYLLLTKLFVLDLLDLRKYLLTGRRSAGCNLNTMGQIPKKYLVGRGNL